VGKGLAMQEAAGKDSSLIASSNAQGIALMS
jgi:hypothetical protein